MKKSDSEINDFLSKGLNKYAEGYTTLLFYRTQMKERMKAFLQKFDFGQDFRPERSSIVLSEGNSGVWFNATIGGTFSETETKGQVEIAIGCNSSNLPDNPAVILIASFSGLAGRKVVCSYDNSDQSVKSMPGWSGVRLYLVPKDDAVDFDAEFGRLIQVFLKQDFKFEAEKPAGKP